MVQQSTRATPSRIGRPGNGHLRDNEHGRQPARPSSTNPYCTNANPYWPLQRGDSPTRLDGMDDHLTLTARLDNAEAARRRLAADHMSARAARLRAERAATRADRAYFDLTDAEADSPEATAARLELGAALMDLRAQIRRLDLELGGMAHAVADLADTLDPLD